MNWSNLTIYPISRFLPNFQMHRVNWFTELFDRVNCLIRRFFDTNNCFSKNLKIFRFFKTFRFFPTWFRSKYLDSSFAFQVGIFAVGGIIGSFLTKVLTTKFGRKGSQAINMFISIAGAANFIGAYQYSSPGMDYVIMTSSWLYNASKNIQTCIWRHYTLKIHKKACFTVARILLGIFSGFATGVCPSYTGGTISTLGHGSSMNLWGEQNA